MADYREGTVAGQKWQRAYKVEIFNPLGSPPSICFNEEEIINLGDKRIGNHVDLVSCVFDPTNPVHLQLYDILNNMYTELREKRDNTPPVEV